MLRCTCSDVLDCPALDSNFECFPWCDFLKDDGTEETDNVGNLPNQSEGSQCVC